MDNNKLYSILKQFDRVEQNRMRKYILSPYFNKNQQLTRFFEILTAHINGEMRGELRKEDIWSDLTGNEPYNDVRFRKMCSELLQLIEGFLAQEIYEENSVQQVSYLIEAVGRKKMEKLYNSSIKKARLLSEQQFNRSADFYYIQFQIEKGFYELSEVELKRADKGNVEEIINNLDRFYLAEKLKYYTISLSRTSLVSHEYKLLFIDEIIEHLKKYKYEDVPPVAIYYQIFLTYTETENEDHYFKLRSLIDQYGSQFPGREASAIYFAALNFCVRKVNQGSQVFLREYFNLYKDLLDKELVLENGILSPWNFNNVVLASLRLGEYNWTEQFINQFKEKLPEDFRENAVSFNLARVYFYQKRYDKVLSLLQHVEYEDMIYNLGSKAMLLAIYYEQDEIEVLEFFLESFRTFLNRHKDIPEQRRKNYQNLIKYTKRLTKILPGDQKSLQKLREEIEITNSIQGIYNYTWLLEKIAELE